MIEIVVVNVEALVQAEPGFEGKTTDEGASSISFVFKELDQSQPLCRDNKIGIVVNAVAGRRRSEKDVGVGGKSCWIVGESLAENNAFGGEAVKVRSLEVSGAVETDPIRPERVDGDEEHIRSCLRLAGGRAE